MSLLMNNVFKQVRDHLRDKDIAGSSTFRLLLRLLSTYSDHGDQDGAFGKRQASGIRSTNRHGVFDLLAGFDGVDVGGATF